MKLLLAAALVASPLLAACAHPLERVVEEHRQQRVGASYAGKPITEGAGDGIGRYVAQSAESRLTLSDRSRVP